MYLHPELCPCQLPVAQGPPSDPAASDRVTLTDTFPRPAPNWCPWHTLSEAGVCPGALQSTQKPLKLPDFLSPCPLSNLPQPLERHQSRVVRIHSRARLQGCIPSLRKAQFVYLPGVGCSCPTQTLFLPPCSCGAGEQLQPRPWPGWRPAGMDRQQ